MGLTLDSSNFFLSDTMKSKSAAVAIASGGVVDLFGINSQPAQSNPVENSNGGFSLIS